MFKSVDKVVFSKSKQVFCLAPMVRAGVLPLRLLALDYGADVVYSDEIIDHKLVKSVRRVNAKLGTVDFHEVGREDRVVFRTCAMEQGRNILQLGTCSAERSLKAAKLVEQDVVGIDINMGCPLPFSVSGGMGSALLQNSDTAADIVRTLRQHVNLQVTCKIRLLDEEAQTIQLVKKLESAGAHAIAVHLRHVSERPDDPAHHDKLKAIVDAVDIPVLANGDIPSKKDGVELMNATGACGILFARTALRQPAVFAADTGSLDEEQQWRDYLVYCALADSHVATTKYTLNRMFKYSKSAKYWKREEAKGLKEDVNRCKTLKDVMDKFGLLQAWEQRDKAWPFPKDKVTSPLQLFKSQLEPQLLHHNTPPQKRQAGADLDQPPQKKSMLAR